MFEPDIEALPFEAQAGIDDVLYRRQVALPLRPLPLLPPEARRGRVRFGRGGRRSRRHRGAADDREGRDPADAERRRAGRHPSLRAAVRQPCASSRPAAPPARRATSRSPPATSPAGRGSRREATPPPASGAARALISTYGAGPFVAGITFDAFNLMGLTHIPIGGGNTERLMTTVRMLKPDAIALTPSYALHLAEWAQGRGIDTRASSVSRLVTGGEPGGGEPAMRKQLEDAVGRDGDRGDGHRRHRRLAVGRVPRAGRHALQRPRLRPLRADRPRDRRRGRDDRRGRRRAGLHPPRPGGGPAAALPEPRPRPARGPDAAPAGGRRRGCAASAAPTTC